MEINYKHASAGYIGYPYKAGTVNSKYYYHFINELNSSSIDFSNLINFPQKIPRLGFFTELCNLETTDFTNQFKRITHIFETEYDKAINELNNHNSEKNIRIFLNWAYLLSRYSKFNKISEYFTISHLDWPLEIKLLNELNKIQILLSNDKVISINGLLELAKKFMHDENTTDREKIILLNQIITNYYRHQKHSIDQNDIVEFAKYLLILIKKYNDSSFRNSLYSSIAYRGIAMVHQFGQNIQEELLEEAEIRARNLKGETELEKLVAADNLYTCLQTLSKWHFQTKNLNESENYLLEMIELDPYDSIAYSELGFFYIKNKSYKNAATQFKKALALGPPGTGMNAYYNGKCLEMLGDETNAVAMLYQSAELDDQAISPWIDLMNYFIEKNNFDKAIEIANHINKVPILAEQLEENEIITIQGLIK